MVKLFTIGRCDDRTKQDDFSNTNFHEIAELTANAHHSRQFGFITKAMEFVMSRLPPSVAETLVPDFGKVLGEQKVIAA